MNTELDKRAILVNLTRGMNDSDIQQMIAYAAGYEAGKINKNSPNTFEQSYSSKNLLKGSNRKAM